ncbi:hypothetical protein [Sphingomonas sp.]|uniref:hypothetical protein n=1 Tax=Sphingomonas sp. TaxID=28214 RepID=UPI0035C84E55
MPETAPGIGVGEIQALIDKSMPRPSTVTPSSEAVAGSAGSNTAKYAQEGHQHPRLTSTTLATLGADATAIVTFTRSFKNKPGVVMTEIDANTSQPLVMVVQSFVLTDGAYTGCVVKGYRSQPLPSQSQLSVASLLSGVITTLNAMASSLTGFNVFGGTAAGAAVSVIAIARSDV